MSLREAKRVKIGDKVVSKETGELLTVSNKTFVQAGVGYPQDAIRFEFEETDIWYYHQFLRLDA